MEILGSFGTESVILNQNDELNYRLSQCFFLGMYPEISGYFGGWRKFLGYPMWSKSPKYVEKRVQKHSDLHLDSKNSVWRRLRRAKGQNEQKTRF